MLQPIERLASEIPGILINLTRHNIAFARAVNREATEFLDSALIASQISLQAAQQSPLSFRETTEVAEHSFELSIKALSAMFDKMKGYGWDQTQSAMSSFLNTVLDRDGEKLIDFTAREASIMESVADFHEEIEKIKDEFGFQLNTSAYRLVDDTELFELYQVMPTKPDVVVDNNLKPMLLVSPYMLGAHILSFLPNEDKSYAHAFANAGIPTYIRIVKDIMEEENVQRMIPEDDCLQTKQLCQTIHAIHGKKVTLNGTCQGGYICLMNILSGMYRDVCDTLITNVTPIDGTYSRAISGMPSLHHDFITTELPNGNRVANGYLLSLGMRMIAIDRETPLVRVLDQASLQRKTERNPGKTVAALFRWLLKERVHLPIEIAKMSSTTFREPINEYGDLPVRLFDRPLNVKDLAKYGIKWYQNYAIKDDLVTPECATAANKHLENTNVLEVVPFPGGHVAILTSPYNRKAPVDDYFMGIDGKEYRGPVKFQLDIS